MVRVKVIVEGQTEEIFVRKVLAGFFELKGIYLYALLTGKPTGRGGVPRWQKARRDFLIALKQDPKTIVTTMFDYYGMPLCWPGREESKGKSAKQAHTIIEAAIAEDIYKYLGNSFDKRRFIPYVQMHEFEALLFSDTTVFAQSLGDTSFKTDFQAIRKKFVTPEEINDDPLTAPSKRIAGIYNSYDKTSDGPLAAEKIGIEKIRAECPHFNEWMSRLELLAQ
jgi:hypothetical protein